MGLHVFFFISSRSYTPCRYVMAIAYSFSLTGQCLLRARMGARLSCWITYCVFFFFVRFSSFFSFFLSFFFSASFLFSFFLSFFIICVVTTMYEYACMVVTAAASAATIARFCYWAVIQQRWREKKLVHVRITERKRRDPFVRQLLYYCIYLTSSSMLETRLL